MDGVLLRRRENQIKICKLEYYHERFGRCAYEHACRVRHVFLPTYNRACWSSSSMCSIDKSN